MAESLETAYFDLRMVHDHFDRALLHEDDIDIRAYLEAYNELHKWVRQFALARLYLPNLIARDASYL